MVYADGFHPATIDPSLRLLLRATLWGLIIASGFLFWLITYARPTRWFRESEKHNVHFTEWNLEYTGNEVDEGYPAALLYGLWITQILVQWLPNVSAIIFVCMLCAYTNAYKKCRDAGNIPPQENVHVARINGAARWMKYWFKRILFYQLPPRGFWTWWCDGLSVLDVFLVLCWLALHVVWIQQTFSRTFALLDAKIDAGAIPGGKAQAEARGEAAGSTFGWVSLMDLLLVFYPVPRSSFLMWAFKAEFPKMIRYHRWLSIGLMLTIFVHAMIFYGLWWNMHIWVEQTFLWNRHTVNNLAGSLAWWISLIIWGCSSSNVRRNAFKVFYNVHIWGVPLFMLFTLMHYKYAVYYMLPGVIVYLLDLGFRWWQLAIDRSHATVSLLHGSSRNDIATVELVFSPVAAIYPGSWVVVHFPTISHFQRHPFTIAEVRRNPVSKAQHAFIHIKAGGWWTRDILIAAQANRYRHHIGGEPAKSFRIPVTVDGPYGMNHGLTTPKYDAAAFIAGGVGATPALAILLDLVRRKAEGKPVPGKVYFVFANKIAEDFPALIPLEIQEAAGRANDWLEMSLYTTQPPALEAGSKKGEMAHPIEDPTCPLLDTTSSVADAPEPRQLQGYEHGFAAYAVAGTLSFFGAFAGLLPAAVYDAHEARRTATGSEYCVVGLLQFVGVILGAILPPFVFVILPSFIIRKWKAMRIRAAGLREVHAAPADVLTKAEASIASTAIKDAGLEGGAAIMANVQQGRPDLGQFMRDIQAKHQGAQEIPVIFSGPKGMRNQLRDTCQDLSMSTAVPYLDFEEHSFML